jgi:hypothetical protein
MEERPLTKHHTKTLVCLQAQIISIQSLSGQLSPHTSAPILSPRGQFQPSFSDNTSAILNTDPATLARHRSRHLRAGNIVSLLLLSPPLGQQPHNHTNQSISSDRQREPRSEIVCFVGVRRSVDLFNNERQTTSRM